MRSKWLACWLVVIDTFIVDAPAMVLKHLGVEAAPQWKLDGKPVGLKNEMNESETGGLGIEVSTTDRRFRRGV